MTPEHALPALYRQKERRRELAVRLFVIVGVITAAVLLFVLTDPALFRGRYYLKTSVTDAGGVRRGDPVQMRGVNIGRIRRFSIKPDGVQLELEIGGEFAIPEGSRVVLNSGGLLGGRVATILPGEGKRSVSKGATLPGTATVDPIAQAGVIADKAGQTLERLQSILSQDTVTDVESSAASARAMMEELRTLATEQRHEIRRLTESLRHSSKGLEKAVAGPELERTVQRLDAMTEQLESTVGKLGSSATSLEAVLGRIERGEGTLGRLTRDDTLYVGASRAAANIDQSATELRLLIEDVRKNPRKYLNLEIF